ncbi:BZ3500_MvSof-1268-A1-R1_Chr5-2g07975 [Microbotryum saponariae]|uniref:BZ3500_MvSof-1268-A1-R1_Chr5-2g07975 protein n=1 Tax=Microbotryum saponariae TaxID=289078 RepID=A0A2X0LFQ7_9BASI|nr:BZ3500_MvSof-1268-A1-R1_Chr5-2g07975 [Microbotryum saponariae]SDA05844.1 BZ3501_MvSof-1269-A2-R1_Chr5-2g07797 [Microbotryum saponariae]
MQRLRSILTSKNVNTNDPGRPTSYRVNPAFEDDLDSEDINAERRGAAGRHHGRKHLFRRSQALPDHRPRTSSTHHNRGKFTTLLLVLHILSSPIAITVLQILTIVHSNQTVKVLEGLQDGAFLPLNGTRVIHPVTGSANGGVGSARRSRRATVVFEGFGSLVSLAVSDLEGRSSAKEERSSSGVRATLWKRTSGLVTNELGATSTLQASTGDNGELIVSEACATYLVSVLTAAWLENEQGLDELTLSPPSFQNEPIEWIARFKISSLTLTIFQIWMLVILGVAWYHTSSSHLGAVALSQTLVSCFAIAQAAFTYEHYASFASGIFLGPCSLGQALIPDFWSLAVKSQIAVAILQLFGSAAIAVFAVKFANVRLRWPNFREFSLSSLRSWALIQPHGYYGGSNEPSQHARRRVLVSSFELLSTSSIFFVVALQAIWLRETIHRPSPAFDSAPNWLGVPEQIGVGVLMVLGTYVMAMGQVGLRFQFMSVMVLSLLGNLAFLVHTSCLLSQSTFRVVQASSSFLSFLLVISTALVLLTLVLGTATIFSRPVWSSIGADGSEGKFTPVHAESQKPVLTWTLNRTLLSWPVAQSDSSYDDGDAKLSDLHHSTASSKDISSTEIVDYRRPKPGQAYVQSHILNRPPSTSHASHHPRHSRVSSTSTINTAGTWKESVFGRQRSRSMSLELATSRMIPLRSLGSQDLIRVEAPAAQSLRSERMTSASERGTILAMANEDLIDEGKEETDLFRRVTPRRLRNPSKASLDVPMPAIPDEDALGVGGDDPFRPVTPRRLRQPSVPLDAEDAEDVDAIVAGEAAVRSSARGVDQFTWTTAEPFAPITASKDEFSSHSKFYPESGSILSPTQATPSSPSPMRSVRAPKGPPTLSAVPKPNLFPLSHLSLSDFLFQTPSNAPTSIPVPVPTLRITDAQDRQDHGSEHDVPLRPLPQAQIYDRSKTHRVRSADQQGGQVNSSHGRTSGQPNKKQSTMGHKPLQDASIRLHQEDCADSKSSSTSTPLGPEPTDRRESVLDRPHPLVYERWTVNWPALE